jgi:L-threonylcarbamoyladenylate synthase
LIGALDRREPLGKNKPAYVDQEISATLGSRTAIVIHPAEAMAIEKVTDKTIARAAQALREGRLVAFPTETVYGLGADATNGEAVAKIFEVKGRPRFNPLIAHVPGVEAARVHAEFSDASIELAKAFWPGALTLVLLKNPDCQISDLATAGLETVALRAPAHPVATDLLEAAGMPVAAPSANRSGHVSPTTAAHVEADLGDGPTIILDGGACPLGLESTVVDMSGERPCLLRPGAISREDIEDVLGQNLETVEPAARPASPGQLASHYAPRAALRLDVHHVNDGEALLAFGTGLPGGATTAVNLSETGDLREAAANFFAALRTLDESGCATIAVMPIPDEGLGEAINDRLRRGAAPRGN